MLCFFKRLDRVFLASVQRHKTVGRLQTTHLRKRQRHKKARQKSQHGGGIERLVVQIVSVLMYSPALYDTELEGKQRLVLSPS